MRKLQILGTGPLWLWPRGVAVTSVTDSSPLFVLCVTGPVLSSLSAWES